MNEDQCTTSPNSLPAIVRLPEVLQTVGLSRPSIYRLMKLGQFPQQVKLGVSSVGWLRSEVIAWITLRMDARVTLPPPLQQAA